METFWLSPPVALCIYLLIAYGLYRLGGAIAARGVDSVGKYKPYASGEDLLPAETRLSYHVFFRMALMFGVLHVAALVLSTLPLEITYHRLALFYLAGVGISVLVLTTGGH